MSLLLYVLTSLIVLALCFWVLSELEGKGRFPAFVAMVFRIVLVIVGVVWLIRMLPALLSLAR